MDKIKVIFLDVDGVLNHKEFLLSTHDVFSLDTSCLTRLRRLVDVTGARLVLSSSWRRSENKIKYLEEKIGIKFYGMTKNDYKPRGVQISDWLKEHKEVEDYIILDDEDFDIKDCRLVKTSFENGGLLDCHVKRGIEMLGFEQI